MSPGEAERCAMDWVKVGRLLAQLESATAAIAAVQRSADQLSADDRANMYAAQSLIFEIERNVRRLATGAPR